MFGWLRLPAIVASRRKLSVAVSQSGVVVVDGEIDGLEREDAIDHRIATEIDVAHRAAADGLEQLVAPDRRRHPRPPSSFGWRMVGAHEPLRDIAKLAVDLRDAMKEIRCFVGCAVCAERAGEIVDLREQCRRRGQLAIQRPSFLEPAAIGRAPRARERVVSPVLWRERFAGAGGAAAAVTSNPLVP